MSKCHSSRFSPKTSIKRWALRLKNMIFIECFYHFALWMQAMIIDLCAMPTHQAA